jgi:hypothetical protein
MGTSGARQLFSTGNGGVVMRAITHIEQSMGKKPRHVPLLSSPNFAVSSQQGSLVGKDCHLVNDKKKEIGRK